MEAEDKSILTQEIEYSTEKKGMTHLFRCRIHNIQISFQLWNLHENYMQGASEQLNFSVARKQNYLIITKNIVWLSSDLG